MADQPLWKIDVTRKGEPMSESMWDYGIYHWELITERKLFRKSSYWGWRFVRGTDVLDRAKIYLNDIKELPIYD